MGCCYGNRVGETQAELMTKALNNVQVHFQSSPHSSRKKPACNVESE